jgi:hypothetical protein
MPTINVDGKTYSHHDVRHMRDLATRTEKAETRVTELERQLSARPADPEEKPTWTEAILTTAQDALRFIENGHPLTTITNCLRVLVAQAQCAQGDTASLVAENVALEEETSRQRDRAKKAEARVKELEAIIEQARVRQLEATVAEVRAWVGSDSGSEGA